MNNDINNNFNIPTNPIFNNKEVNPGFVDVDKIENQAQDITFENPAGGVVNPETNKEPFNPFGQTNLSNNTVEQTIKEPEIKEEQEQINNDVEIPMQPNVMNTPQNNEGNRFFNIFQNHINNENEPNPVENIAPSVEETKNISNQPLNPFGQPTQIDNEIEQPVPLNPFGNNEVTVEPQQESVSPFEQPIQNVEPPVEPIQQTTIENIISPDEEVQPVEIKPFNPFEQVNNDINNPVVNDVNPFEGPINYDMLPEEKELEPLMQTTESIDNKVDFKTIINMIRDCSDKIEKYGYKIELEELDFEDSYQVNFKIEK